MHQLRVLLMVLALPVGLFAAESPFTGTWKLNPAKSKLPPPALKSETAVVDADDNGLKLTDEMVDDKDQSLKVSYEVKFDGKDYPVTGDPNSDVISFQRVNAHMLKAIAKKGGKVTSRGTIVVSKDGKVTTVNFTDYTQAQPAKGTAVYDKQ
jgi:hypothetical protein